MLAHAVARLGNRPSAPTGWLNFTGLIDETAIYRRALTPAEVQGLWGAGSKGKSTHPSFTATASGTTNVTRIIPASSPTGFFRAYEVP